MANKQDLQDWIVDILKANGGSAMQIEVARAIWSKHAQALEASGDLFYTWQYDLRWEAKKLRDKGVIKPVDGHRGGPWELAKRP